MKLYIVSYINKDGVRSFPFLLGPGALLPPLSNALLELLGAESIDEDDGSGAWASMAGPFELDSLPVIRKGVLDWTPPAED